MLPARRVLSLAHKSGELPRIPILEPIYSYGIHLRRGQVFMIAGQPGSMKSLFGQWIAEELKVPVLYFCADSDPHTAITRLISKITGYTIRMVESESKRDPRIWRAALMDSQITYCFDSSPTLEDIADEVAAYVELWDRYPHLLVIDNLMNVDASVEDMSGLRLASKEIHRLARETSAAVLVLHHTREGAGEISSHPQPRSSIQGKVSLLPEVILTVAIDQDGTFRMAPVKNRSGPSDPTGRTFFSLRSDPERSTFWPVG